MPAKHPDFDKLIPEMKDWNNGNGIDIDSWVGCMANHKFLVGCARILWPNFVEHDGCVLLGDSVDEANYNAFLKNSNGNKTTVEATMNHWHIFDLFATERPTRELVLYVGRKMKEIWQVKLQNDFPGRKITVWFPEEDNLEDLEQYQLTFFQER
jgi:hypothetical protein